MKRDEKKIRTDSFKKKLIDIINRRMKGFIVQFSKMVFISGENIRALRSERCMIFRIFVVIFNNFPLHKCIRSKDFKVLIVFSALLNEWML